MKNTILISLLIFLFSCSKDSINTSESFKSNYKVLGKYYDLNINGGTESRSLFEYESLNGNHDSFSYSDLNAEIGLENDRYYDYYANSEGITFRQEVFGGDNIFYHKSFLTNRISNIRMPYVFSSNGTYFHLKSLIYFFHEDYNTFSSTDGTREYNIDILNPLNGQISKYTLGRFQAKGNTKFELRLAGNIIYFLFNQDVIDNNSDQQFIVFDLEKLEVLYTTSILKPDVYNLVLDQSGDCYLFGRENFSKYNFSSESITDIDIPESNLLLSGTFPSSLSPQLVIDNKCYFGLGGAFPGTGAVYPSIYDLNTGELITIDIYSEVTQFDDDLVEWNPLAKCYSLDYENKVFLIGVESANLGGQFKSQGIFTVDFNGNILNKQKIPILPEQIIN